MKRVVFGKEMKAVDAYTINQIGIPSLVLMERAAYSCVPFLKDRQRILVAVGCGNNGADGIALARMLWLHHQNAEIYVVGTGEGTPEWQTQKQIAENLGIPFVTNPDYSTYDSIVDAIFGVGLSRTVTGGFAEVIDRINASGVRQVLAVDLPSGIDSTTGAVLGTAVRADQTVTFGAMKTGLLLYPGAEYAGEIHVADIGFPECAYAGRTAPIYYDMEPISGLLPARPAHSNKGTYGKILIIAGSGHMGGACFLCADAAYRSGAGIVRILTHENNRLALQKQLPEAILSFYRDGVAETELQDALDWASVIVAGPGLGQNETAAVLVWNALKSGKPLILDADGLNILAARPEWKSLLHPQMILTPHLGEMARLTGTSIAQIQASVLETALAYAKENRVTCILKDAHTVVADWNQNLYLNAVSNPGMAKGGSGDVLAGILGAMAGNKALPVLQEFSDNPMFTPAVYGVCLHSQAGGLAAKESGEYSMNARDIIRSIKEIIR